ncbi:MAG: hypothetical protein H0T51_02280 [Pirellulales bacterium]|nr:hypothetical protein [Pirellulales bacterium]
MSNWRSITNEKEKYAAYLCSREWAVLKEAVRERSGGICERCRLLPMDATHHLTSKYQETIEDLQAICTSCHNFTHGKSSFDPTSHIAWLRYLLYCKSNGKNAVDSAIVVVGQSPAEFIGGALLMAVRAIHECHEIAARVLRENTESFDDPMVIRELEVVAELAEKLFNINCAYAAWLRFGQPAIAWQLFDESLLLVGVKEGHLTPRQELDA